MVSETVKNRPIRLGDYRYPGELLSLVLTFVIITAIFGVATIVFPATWSSTLKTLLITTAGLGVYILTVKLQQRSAFGTMVRVGPRQFPELYEISQTVTTRLSSPPVAVYVKRASEMNIYTLGLWQKPIIVLTSSIVDQMDPENLQFFIGREVGHIQAGHTWLRTLLKPVGADVPVIGKLLNSVVFGDWIIRGEFTADRSGFIACQSLTVAISTMLKFGVGIKLYQQLDIREFLDQIKEVRNVKGHLTEIMAEQPYLTQRVRTLVKFALSDKFRSMVPDRRRQTQILEAIPEAFVTTSFRKIIRRHDEERVVTLEENLESPVPDEDVITVFDVTGELDDNPVDPNCTLVTEDGRTTYALRLRLTRIGRNKDNDIVLASNRASRYHAEITRNGDETTIHDLGSRNGVWVNSARIKGKSVINSGDIIRIGREKYIFAIKD